MSRAATAALTAALLASVALGADAAGANAAGECAWTQHSRRVVKKVRRHGEVRRVKRIKHYWTCDPAPATPSPLPAVPPPLGLTPPPTQTGPPPIVSALGVKAEEWSYTLSRPEVPAGEVIVQLNNMGEDPHNLNIRPQGSEDPELLIPITAPLQQTTKRFTLAAGTYRLWCDLDEHDEKGMHATLVVGGS